MNIIGKVVRVLIADAPHLIHDAKEVFLHVIEGSEQEVPAKTVAAEVVDAVASEVTELRARLAALEASARNAVAPVLPKAE
jgi:hypothetical protein